MTRPVGRASASSPWSFVGNKQLERQEEGLGTRRGEGEERKRERETERTRKEGKRKAAPKNNDKVI